MTISISGVATGAPDHKLEIVQGGIVRQTVEMGGSFSTAVWAGAPIVLRESLGGAPAHVITEEDVTRAFRKWGADRIAGHCTPHEVADSMDPDERAALEASAFMAYLTAP